VRRFEQRREDAQDLTQEFFCFLLENNTFGKADQERGRFRSFLLTTLKHFLANQRHHTRAEKRGGKVRVLSLDFDTGESYARIDLAYDLAPEKVYERRWVLTLLDQVVGCLRQESVQEGKELQFEQLKRALTENMSQHDYDRAGEALGISGAAAKQAAYRLRKRYRAFFRAEIARTVTFDSEIDDEIGRLLQFFSD
jgi:RNA polymerase sigma-70 factor (ECF subfamily)